jgi:hypothetical protein
MTLRTNLQRALIAAATFALAILPSAARADCQKLLASEPGYRAEITLTFPSKAAESEFRRTLEEQAGLNLDETRMFFDCIKIAVKHDDKDTLSQLIRYPLRTHTAKGKHSIQTPMAFKKAYPLIFNATVKHAIEVQRFEDLFVSYRGLMIGNGEVWISGIVEPTSGKTTLKIIAINNQ